MDHNRALLRVMGRRDLTAAVINSVIGAGIFGLPSAVAALTGSWSPVAVLLAGLGRGFGKSAQVTGGSSSMS